MRSSDRPRGAIIVARLVVASIAAAGLLHAQSRTFDLLTASVADIQTAVGSGALTYEKLIRLYLNRINAFDKHGPCLNAVIEINRRAIEIARALDEERQAKGLRSPLHGIPIAIKDNIDVIDMPSAGGSLALAGTYPDRDATVIQRLRQAGAIIFLKTNMDDLALGSRGLSSLGGQILNPYDLQRNPGGSSGGTAVAVNVGFATLGVATETGFSIRSPASNNALVGIAPTRGLVSRAGVMPISFTQDRVGVHAKSVADAALLLTHLRGFDPEDLATADSLGKVDPKSYTEYLNDELAGKRIGVLRDLFRKGKEFELGNKLIDGQIALLHNRRAIVIDGLSTGRDLVSLMPLLRVNSYELRTAFDAYLSRRGPSSPVKTLAGLIATGKYLKGGTQEIRYQETMRVGTLDANADYLSRLETQRTVRRLLVELMDRNSVEALVYPVKALPAPMLGSSDDGPRDNSISAATGLPAIILPAGLSEEGLPLALEILGRPFSEPMLIQLAYGYEQASHARVAPKTTPHLTGEVFAYK
jgi:amidase